MPSRPAPTAGRLYIADQNFSYESSGGYGEATLDFRTRASHLAHLDLFLAA
ncbi:hypothetical protein OG887_39880 [Streptomyces sp. NBC_00053]|uniref:hypothetical protein n=1 Tax=unclassified Streptomyces TaxID=2593676 RepID=UPI000F9A0ECD|nr:MULTISPECIES: hypothetical protein [unclassified Streptomyces]WSG48490.1 hypothetical protein OHA38_00785 [Streptomyces sp. NBC_01732]WSW99140.1 hypothetical protein OG355_00895 [Streptomyces sp. NBC_00987]MCX4399422.1 hypothetical protein [Streptomyces sp. NBC_01767]MCX5103140.1 hypothetical protein [Streptomyces sp. NBC_00439]MCX5165965.1 hypothetical protein [Streptomyces sp. NBC_00305]